MSASPTKLSDQVPPRNGRPIAAAHDRAAYLEALFQASPMGVAVTVERVFVEVNDRLCRMTGYRRDELLGQPTRVFHESDAANAAIAAAVYPQLAREGFARTEVRLRCKDAQLIDVVLSLAPLYPSAPERGVISTVLDVTAYRRARALLQTRVDLSEAVARGDREAVLNIALGRALESTRSTTAMLQLGGDAAPAYAVASGPPQPAGAARLLLLSADRVADLRASDPDSAPARCLRSVVAAGAARGPVGTDDSLPTEASRELAVPILRAGRAAAVLAVAEKPAAYTANDAEVLEELVSMALDALDALDAQAALRESEVRCSSAMEAARDGMWDWDIRTGNIAVNESYLRMLGLPAAPLHLHIDRWRRLVHPQDLEQVDAAFGANLTSDALTQVEYRLRTSAGDWCRVLARGRIVARDAGGRPLRMIGTHTDVTEMRRTEADLRTALDRLELALQSGGLGLYDVDLISGEGEVDERYLAQLGLPTDARAFTLARWCELLHPDDRTRLEHMVEEAIERHADELTVEYRMRHAGGGWRWIYDRARVYARDPESGLLRVAGIHLDITDRKAAEAALTEANKTLEERVAERTAEVRRQSEQLRALAIELTRAERRERERLAAVLHDHIQQLMVAATIQAERIKRHAETEQLRGAAEVIEGTLREALGASRSLTVELRPPALHQRGLVGGLNWLASRLRTQHHFAVGLHLDRVAEPADEEARFLLFECARELLINAVKHADVNQAELRLERTAGPEIRLVVSDRGRGFDTDAARDRGPDEQTFGLFSIRERLAHLGGQMLIESAPRAGTRITLRLPVAEEQAPESDRSSATASESATTRPSPPARRCRLLLVDDHRVVREGLTRLFESEPDIEVCGQAADGLEAVEKATALKPDVVIMDVNLGPGIDGLEATRRILARDPSAKIIGLSMHDDEEVARAMREAGAAAYRTKGAPVEDLISAVLACLRVP